MNLLIQLSSVLFEGANVMEIMQTKLQEEVERLQAVQKQGWIVFIGNAETDVSF